jgi:UDP-glucose 4-epimerase
VDGNNDSIIKNEDDTYADVCESPYTASKIGGEAFVESYSNCYDIDTSIVRFSNVYGKYDDSDRVIPLFISLAKNGDDLVVYGEEKVLDFTYITDCIDGIEKVIENYGKGKNNTFNIASGMGRSLVELANLVKEKTNSNSNIVIHKSRTGEVQQYVANIDRANKILDYSPDISLDEGLDKTIEWYNNNPHLLDDLK